MSDDTYAYDASVAETASGDIEQLASGIENTLSEMDGDMRKLAGGAWEGEEQEQYQGIHGKWSSSAEQARGVLNQVRAALDENTQGVAETRQNVAKSLQGD